MLAGVWAGAAGRRRVRARLGPGAQVAGAVAYVSLGWFAMVASPQIVERAGVAALVLILGGRRGLHRRRSRLRARAAPTRGPAVFGYHEVFHVLVVVAAVVHFVAVAAFALPRG